METSPDKYQGRDYYMVDLGNHVRGHREKIDPSIRHFANSINMSYPYLTNLENGKVNPTVSVLRNIAHGLGLEVEINFVEPDKHRTADSTTSDA